MTVSAHRIQNYQLQTNSDKANLRSLVSQHIRVRLFSGEGMQARAMCRMCTWIECAVLRPGSITYICMDRTVASLIYAFSPIGNCRCPAARTEIEQASEAHKATRQPSSSICQADHIGDGAEREIPGGTSSDSHWDCCIFVFFFTWHANRAKKCSRTILSLALALSTESERECSTFRLVGPEDPSPAASADVAKTMGMSLDGPSY